MIQTGRIKRSFSLLLTIALWLTAAQTAWAYTQEELSTPLTLEAINAGTITVNNLISGMQYAINDGNKTEVTDNDGDDDWTSCIISVSAGDKVKFYGKGTEIASYGDARTKISCSDSCYIYGNIMSLVGEEGFANNTKLTGGKAFLELFMNNTYLKNHSSKSLVLPATTLTTECYSSMFIGCTGLTKAPELPAAELADGCYNGMFNGCTGLTSAPALNATTLATYCYDSMFYGCTRLTTAPALPADTLVQKCYRKMFYGCTSLTTAPALPADTLVQECYREMFCGCTKLNYINMQAKDISANECLKYWVDGVASSGTFERNSAGTWRVFGISGIPNGWTVSPDFIYTIKFVDYDGTPLQSSEVEMGETPSYTGTTPTRTSTDASYTLVFDGWTPAITAATADVTYTATYARTSTQSFDYVDANGESQTCNSPDYVYDGMNITAWDGWYVASGEVTIADRITVNGDAHLILTDGCTFNPKQGITVTSGNSLTIYGQSEGTGQLTINNVPDNYAGIGGSGWVPDAGTITINGGTLDVTGTVSQQGVTNYGGAAIGGSYSGNAGTITINGGTVTATGRRFGAGIGCGYNSSGGTITINGGTVTATSTGGAGIGNCVGGTAPEIYINGGTVTAISWSTGAGIGAGIKTNANKVTITGGTVNATGSYSCAGIGGGGATKESGVYPGNCGTVTISGGTVTATGGIGAAGIGSGAAFGDSSPGANGGTIIITGGNVTAQSNSGDYGDGYGIGHGYPGNSTNLTADISLSWTDRTNDRICVEGYTGAVTLAKQFMIEGTETILEAGTVADVSTLAEKTLLPYGYTITFVDEDGTTVLQTVKVGYGETPAYSGTTPTKEATTECVYTFSGWTPALTTATANATYTATYTSAPRPYTITFENYDHTVLQSGQVEYGQKPVYSGTTPTRTGSDQYTYTFNGWDPDITTVTGDATYSAVYAMEAVKYTITFEDYNGNVLQSSEVLHGNMPEYTGETPTRAATSDYVYAFTGWTPELTAATAAATYTATYSETRVYQLTGNYVLFNNENGDLITKAAEGATVYVSPDFDNLPSGKYATGAYTSEQVTVTSDDNGDYFTMPAGAVTVTATLADQVEYVLDLTSGSSAEIPLMIYSMMTGLDGYYSYDENTEAETIDLNQDGTADLQLTGTQSGDDYIYTVTKLTAANALTNNYRLALSYSHPVQYNSLLVKLGGNYEVVEQMSYYAFDDDYANNAGLVVQLDGQQKNIMLRGRTLYRDGYWNTLCLPFNVTISGSVLSGATAMELTEASFSASTLTLNFSAVTALEAGKPYIIKWDDPNDELDDLVNPTFVGVTISKDLQPSAFTNVVTFTGNYDSQSFTADNKSILLMGGTNTLYYPQSGASIRAFRAYFQLANGITAGDPANGIRNFVLDFGEETNSLNEELRMKNEESAGARWYTIDGRKLSGKPSAKGVYIYNGKKVIVK